MCTSIDSRYYKWHCRGAYSCAGGPCSVTNSNRAALFTRASQLKRVLCNLIGFFVVALCCVCVGVCRGPCGRKQDKERQLEKRDGKTRYGPRRWRCPDLALLPTHKWIFVHALLPCAELSVSTLRRLFQFVSFVRRPSLWQRSPSLREKKIEQGKRHARERANGDAPAGEKRQATAQQGKKKDKEKNSGEVA